MTATEVKPDDGARVIEVPGTEPRLVISLDELAFAYSRSGGPGGGGGR